LGSIGRHLKGSSEQDTIQTGSGALLVIDERPSGRRENTTAEQVEIGAAEHVALEHLQPVDVSLDRPRTPTVTIQVL
jgi:hypothetical protein